MGSKIIKPCLVFLPAWTNVIGADSCTWLVMADFNATSLRILSEPMFKPMAWELFFSGKIYWIINRSLFIIFVAIDYSF